MHDLGILESQSPYNLGPALVVADDLMHCSPELKDRLLEVLASPEYTEMNEIGGIILETASHYDLTTSDGAARFCRMHLRRLSWGDGWRPVCELESLRRTITSWVAQGARHC